MKYLIWVSKKLDIIPEVVRALKSENVHVDILLLQDGVYLADRGNPMSGQLKGLGIGIHALSKHVEERGILARLIAQVNLINYGQMVELMMEKSDKVISL